MDCVCWAGQKPQPVKCQNELEDVWVSQEREYDYSRAWGSESQDSIEESRKCDDTFPQFELSISSLE